MGKRSIGGIALRLGMIVTTALLIIFLTVGVSNAACCDPVCDGTLGILVGGVAIALPHAVTNLVICSVVTAMAAAELADVASNMVSRSLRTNSNQ